MLTKDVNKEKLWKEKAHAQMLQSYLTLSVPMNVENHLKT